MNTPCTICLKPERAAVGTVRGQPACEDCLEVDHGEDPLPDPAFTAPATCAGEQRAAVGR